MKHTFAIPPWEYPGATFERAPHARTSLEIDGKKRDFLLKMRDGLIYFKDPKSAPTFAIPHHFNTDLRGDDLITAWRTEVERKNFGLFFWRPLRVMDYATTTIIAGIVRPDFSGWLTDALQVNWLEIPKHRDGKVFDVWKGNRSKAIRRATDRTKHLLIDRPIHEGECQSLPPRWFSGSESELERVLSLVTQLYMRGNAPDSLVAYPFAATNFASQGGFFDSSFNPLYHPDLRLSPALPALLRVLDQQFVWVALEWKYRRSNLDRTNPLKPMQDKWGAQWRANYSLETPHLAITVPLVASLSSHQKLELSLQLRDWLEDKITPRQSANYLAQALD